MAKNLEGVIFVYKVLFFLAFLNLHASELVQIDTTDINHILVKSKLPKTIKDKILNQLVFYTKPIACDVKQIEIAPEYPFYAFNPLHLQN